jgi:uncharacterized protein (DUF2236 family)
MSLTSTPNSPRLTATPLDPMRLIHWASGAPMSSALPIADTTPDPGLFGPGTVTWRLHSEQWLIAAGARAFLMQAAHPVVAQGALDHSRFAEDPFGRVANTVRAMTTLIFGTTAEAHATARRINRLHLTVTGTLPETAGTHPAGSAYSAMDSGALLWVHVAFVDSILSAYRNFVGPLTYAVEDAYWRESFRYAHLLGLTDADLPPSYDAVRDYIAGAIESGEVRVGEGARTIARTILAPPMPAWRRPIWDIVRSMTVGQLPSALRQQYALPWRRRERVLFALVCGWARLMRYLFPQYLGRSLAAVYAAQRMRGDLQLEPQDIGNADTSPGITAV